MRFLSFLFFAVLLISSCGPGAADHARVPSTEVAIDNARGVLWQRAERLGSNLTGEWRCDACSTTIPGTAEGAQASDVRSTFGATGDANKARLVWEGVVPEGVTTIAVPVIAGGSAGIPPVELSVDWGPTFQLKRPPTAWLYWRVHVKERGGAKRIAIRAIDGDAGDGHWLALGTPRAVD